MGNSESGHSRNAAHATSTLYSSRSRSKFHKVRSPSVDTSQVVTRQMPLIRGRYDSSSDDEYATCKPDVASTRSKDIPASYYFTESQLRNAKKRSKSHEADLNRRLSVSDSQKTDVRQIVWSASSRKSDYDAVSMIYFLPFYTVINSMFGSRNSY